MAFPFDSVPVFPMDLSDFSHIHATLEYLSTDEKFKKYGILHLRPTFDYTQIFPSPIDYFMNNFQLQSAYLQELTRIGTTTSYNYSEVPLPKLTLSQFFQVVSNTQYSTDKTLELFFNKLGGEAGGYKAFYAADIDHSFTAGSTIFDMKSLIDQCGLRFRHRATENWAGITKPFLYAGTSMSHGTPHVEDQWMGSLNMVLWGAPKIWIFSNEEGYDKISFNLQSKLNKIADPECSFCFLKKTLTMSLDNLMEIRAAGAKIFRLVQNPGDIVLTLPKAFHMVINTGQNLAEASQYISFDWASKYGKNAPNCSCDKGPALVIDRLINRMDRELKKHPDYNPSLPPSLKVGLDTIASVFEQTGRPAKLYHCGKCSFSSLNASTTRSHRERHRKKKCWKCGRYLEISTFSLHRQLC